MWERAWKRVSSRKRERRGDGVLWLFTGSAFGSKWNHGRITVFDQFHFTTWVFQETIVGMLKSLTISKMTWDLTRMLWDALGIFHFASVLWGLQRSGGEAYTRFFFVRSLQENKQAGSDGMARPASAGFGGLGKGLRRGWHRDRRRLGEANG